MNFQQTPWKPDPRSKGYDHEKLFGAVPNLPDTLNRPRGPVHDQGPTQRCTGYGSAANGYYIHHLEMNPDWAAHKVGQKMGGSVDTNGADPNSCMKHQRDDGFLPLQVTDKKWQTHSVAGTGYGQWDTSLDFEAAHYDNIPGYVKITPGSYDYFDAIRNALYLAYDPVTQKGAAVDAFSGWYENWDKAIIPNQERDLVGYHRYIFIDWTTIDGVYYLVAQNSYGDKWGDKGYQYFPREVINREFSKPYTSLKILKTLTKEQVELAKQATPFGRIQKMISDIWYHLSIVFGRI